MLSPESKDFLSQDLSWLFSLEWDKLNPCLDETIPPSKLDIGLE
jgi:hypothetical protein